MTSSACRAASLKMITADDELSAALTEALPRGRLMAISPMIAPATFAFRFTLAPPPLRSNPVSTRQISVTWHR
jgi:hypothetical protein